MHYISSCSASYHLVLMRIAVKLMPYIAAFIDAKHAKTRSGKKLSHTQASAQYPTPEPQSMADFAIITSIDALLTLQEAAVCQEQFGNLDAI